MRVVRSLLEHGESLKGVSIGDLYEASYLECVRSRKVEYVYKNALVEKRLLGRHSLRTSSALFELSVGSSKLDALLFTKGASAFEIKTERDELGKLATQIAEYRKAFTDVWVFTCDRHVKNIERIVPPEVGITLLGERYRIKVLRDSTFYTDDLDARTMLRLLRQSDLLTMLGDPSESIPNTRIFSETLRSVTGTSLLDLNVAVTGFLRQRAMSNTKLAGALPRSLAASALALSLTPGHTQALMKILGSPAIRIV